MLQQLKPVASEPGTVTVRITDGAPFATVLVQVTHEQIRDLRLKLKNATREELKLVRAYAKLFPSVD